MQRGLELLPPSYFCLAPPSTIQPSVVRSPGALPKCLPSSGPPPATVATSYPGCSSTQKTGSKASSQSGVYSATSAAGSRGRPTENVVAAWPAAQQLTRQLAGGCGRVDRRQEDLQRSSESRRQEERNDGQLHWSPANGNRSKSEAPPRDRHRDAAIPVRQHTTYGTTGEVKANLQNSRPCEREITSAERNEDHGFRDNTEEALARKLAMCQKIDKSLQFYADVRKKWSDGSSSSNPSQPPSTVAQNSSTHSTRNSPRSSGNPPRTYACAMSTRNQAPPTQSAAAVEKERVRAREDAPRSHRVQKELSKGTVHHPKRTCDTPGGRKSREYGRKPTQNQAKPSRPALNDLGSLPPGRTWTQTVTSTSKKHPTLTLTLVQPNQGGASRETKSENVIRVLDSDKTVEVTSGPKEKVQTPQKVVPVLEPVSPVRPKVESENEKTKLSKFCSSVSFPASGVEKTRGDREKEEEFNDFDSIQQDSDPESVEPLTGKFGEPILTGARPILSPASPVRSTELAAAPEPTTSRQSSCESDGVVRQKTVAAARSDTVLARVLQAEEESRAGVSLSRKPYTPLTITGFTKKV